MKEYKSLSHTRWDCKYHVVFIPKYRRKKMYGAIRTHLGKILHELAKQKESWILEGHLMSDHVHMCISIPPKFAVSNVVGFIKGRRHTPSPCRILFNFAVVLSPSCHTRLTGSVTLSLGTTTGHMALNRLAGFS